MRWLCRLLGGHSWSNVYEGRWMTYFGATRCLRCGLDYPTQVPPPPPPVSVVSDG